MPDVNSLRGLIAPSMPSVSPAAPDATDRVIDGLLSRSSPPRVLSDKMMPWLRPQMAAPHGKLKYDRIRGPLTLVFQVKTLGRYVKPIQGLRNSRDFAKPWSSQHLKIHKEFWYEYLGPNVSYAEAKRQAARYFERFWNLIHVQGQPIAAIRAYLVDWNADKAIPADVLNWRLFSTKTFEGWHMDAVGLRSWGIPADRVDRERLRRGFAGGLEYWDFVTSDRSLLELETTLRPDALVEQAVAIVLPQASMSRGKSTIDLVAIRRALFVIESKPFRDQQARVLIDAYLKDEGLRSEAGKLRTRAGQALKSLERKLVNLSANLMRSELLRRRLIK